MARNKAKLEEDITPGAPEWMVIFSDCMTLLLTFFVLLMSFASFHEQMLPALGQSFADALSSVGLSRSNAQDSIFKTELIRHVQKVVDGSETRTEDSENTSNFMEEVKALDFKNLKVFSVPSDDFFYGKGAAISQPARKILDALTVFLRSVPSRVVISETGASENQNIGLSRAWTVVEYITSNSDLKKEIFSITSSPTTRRSYGSQRMLEITLLEPGICQ